MCTETILKTIQKTCEGKCEYFIHQSDTTNSIYCTLKWGNATTHFRISDHKQKPHKMRSFVYHKGTKVTGMQRFINNAIRDLKTKSLYVLLESMPTITEYA